MATSGATILKIFCTFMLFNSDLAVKTFSKKEIRHNRDRVSRMFHYAYDGYMKYAYPYDELQPLTCDGHDTWGKYSLTLIDALDTLAIMGNYSEFRKVADLVIKNANFDVDMNVSVFETNIRIVGGLVSAHLMSKKAGIELEDGWPCSGPLLNLAENVARRLLPAFQTKTGMPYGTVNFRYGVPKGETTVTSTAGVGTFIVEFGALSKLTGDPVFLDTALRALKALWNTKSILGLVGNHIDVATGKWTALDAGIGGQVDSYFEYLVKGAILFKIPELMTMFKGYDIAIEKYLKRDDWYMWAHMTKGTISLPIFQSLDGYWPGLQSLIGDIEKGMKTILNYHQVWRQYGALPEFYSITKGEAHATREGYPLRPEMIESAMYLYQATKDPLLLQLGVDVLESIEQVTKTSCGYATIKNVRDHTLDNRMESFFLAETTKYLYLLFDHDNFIHNTGGHGDVINTPNGECIINAGGYVFNTEAHPIDPAALYCCSAEKKEQDKLLQEMHDEMDLLELLELTDSAALEKDKDKRSMEDRLRDIIGAYGFDDDYANFDDDEDVLDGADLVDDEEENINDEAEDIDATLNLYNKIVKNVKSDQIFKFKIQDGNFQTVTIDKLKTDDAVTDSPLNDNSNKNGDSVGSKDLDNEKAEEKRKQDGSIDKKHTAIDTSAIKQGVTIDDLKSKITKIIEDAKIVSPKESETPTSAIKPDADTSTIVNSNSKQAQSNPFQDISSLMSDMLQQLKKLSERDKTREMPEIFTCPAQPFHSRFSVGGEMFFEE
ncbi:unnamed protein product [Owenia fusiformis]|uniref:alpha-1,2-Mannosidase n=1 Tax=Owenia fusiformis TaxID=6347 RepID=A0A8J1U051_OWEFU|nr:unnamed protein product [Owenia fusiformis]